LLAYVKATKEKYPDMDESVILNLYTQRGTSTLSIKQQEELADGSKANDMKL
jgi:hypothetical protein